MREFTIENSTIERVQHDGETLRVFYRSGGIWDFSEVSDNLVDSLVKSEDPARFMIHQILPDREPRAVKADSPLSRAWA